MKQMIPNPWRITFDTNPDDCNMECIMCEDHSRYSETQSRRRKEGRAKRRMDIAVIEQVLDELIEAPPREIIPSTMGEPLLYKHFDRILELCDEHRIKLNLTTNGTFPIHGAREWARRIVPVASDVKISFNSVTDTTHESIMCGSRLADVISNIEAFIAVRDMLARPSRAACTVTLQVTFLESNISELAEIVRLASRLGVDRVKGHHLWVHFDQIAHLSMRRSRESVLVWNQICKDVELAAERYRRADGSKVKLANFFPLEEENLNDIAPGGACPFLGREAWINAWGRFDPCCAPDEKRKTLGDFGNVMEKGFLNIWRGADYRRLCREYTNQTLCQSCNMRRPEPVLGMPV